MRDKLFRIAVVMLGPTMTCLAAGALAGTIAAASMERDQALPGAGLLAAIPVSERIVFNATRPVRNRIVVFTDIECPYCRKFHQQLGQYLQAGIEVQYVFYPRAGRDSPAFAKAVAVWCAADRQAALARAFDDRTFVTRTCENPVAAHYELAVRLGLLGTPALITEDGEVMYGALSVSRLLERLTASR